VRNNSAIVPMSIDVSRRIRISVKRDRGGGSAGARIIPFKRKEKGGEGRAKRGHWAYVTGGGKGLPVQKDIEAVRGQLSQTAETYTLLGTQAGKKVMSLRRG